MLQSPFRKEGAKYIMSIPYLTSFTGIHLYEKLQRYVLTEELLRENGYPRPSETSGQALVFKEERNKTYASSDRKFLPSLSLSLSFPTCLSVSLSLSSAVSLSLCLSLSQLSVCLSLSFPSSLSFSLSRSLSLTFSLSLSHFPQLSVSLFFCLSLFMYVVFRHLHMSLMFTLFLTLFLSCS